jgi:superfamily I DNA/RNA helicase
LFSKLLELWFGWLKPASSREQVPAVSKTKQARAPINATAPKAKPRSAASIPTAGELLFANLPLAISPAVRKRMKADAERYLPAHLQPSLTQWKMIFSSAITTCVVAGAGSGKSSALALRVLLLHHYIGLPMQAISVVTFTRASRADFAERLVRLFAQWQLPLALGEARARVTTFHSLALGWARTMPGFSQLQAFESLGAAEGLGTSFQLKINPAQREQLNRCYHSLIEQDSEFAHLMTALRQRAEALPALPVNHPDVQKRLAALQPAAERDLALCQLIEAHWRQAGHWPMEGVEATAEQHMIQGQAFSCHGFIPATGTWVMLGVDPSFASETRPGARLPVRGEWAVKRTLFQAFFDKPLIWIESFPKKSEAIRSRTVYGPGFDYALAGENGAQPVLDAFVAMASFIENLGLEVPNAVSALEGEEDQLFLQALARFWPALERQLLTLQPPALTYNRMFAIFADPQGSALSRLPADALAGISHLLVDEFQDIAPQIARWLKAGLSERLRRLPDTPATLMCVGDDWQSIYGWRGSSPAFFIGFADAFPSPLMRRLMLRENYRSTQQVIDAAEFIVKQAESIPGKSAVAAGAVERFGANVRLRWKDVNHIARTLTEALAAGQSVLLLYRQAKDDPRQSEQLAPMIAAQQRLEAEQRLLRCMTIHGAKGLEAEVVILVGDCTARAASVARNRLYALAGLGSPGTSAPYDSSQADEALRLAYVGITRAAHSVYWYVDQPANGRLKPGAAARAQAAPALFETEPACS